MSEAHKIETSLGNLYLTFTDANHCHAAAGRDEALTVNRVQYRVGVHVYLWSDGRWHIGQEDKNDYERRQSLSATRADWTKVADMYASVSARTKMTPVVEQAVNNFAVNNPGILRAAQLEHLRDEYDKAEAEAIERKNDYDKAVTARIVAHEKFMDFRNGGKA